MVEEQKETTKKPLRRKPRQKRAPKQMESSVREATNKTAGIFSESMMSAGATVVRIKELDVKRHGATGFAQWPDGTRVTLTITNKG